MRRVKIGGQILMIAILLAISYQSRAVEFPKSIQKKIDKEVKRVFFVDEFDFLDVNKLNSDTLNTDAIKNVRLNSVYFTNQLKGYACFASSKGKNDFFDYMVLFNINLEVEKVVVLMYRSSYGGEIMAKSWLKQFVGKARGERMEFGKDIDGISGATLSAPAISNGIKMLSILMSELRKKGEI